MQILDVAVPSLKKGHILAKNYYFLISAGTEGSTVKAARKGYIGKAKERPQQVKQVMDTLMEKGLVQTYRAVMKKLDAHSPLGYSCVGQVIDVADDVREFKAGDFAACGGLTASHAEVVCVPTNLCVKLDPSTDMKQAAYNTLGAIAMQGVRQADLRLGEYCAVNGLGLLGQITCLLLKASGVNVIGIDINESMVEIAAKHCVDLAIVRGDAGIENKIQEYTGGHGCDAVIITAATSSLDPINFAGSISRKKGTIVVSGAVPTGFDREPHFYKKELTIKMSCSYGPGRYDPSYEEKGLDYPYAYVRWTEKRNMKAFQDLIAAKKIDITYLTTHTYKLQDVPAAYDMIMEKTEPFIGILVQYDTDKIADLSKRKVVIDRVKKKQENAGVCIGFIGAGSYAQSYLLPNMPKSSEVVLKGIMTSSSTGSRSVADRFGFEFCTGNVDEILKDPEINTVFIASRHDSHGRYVIETLKAGKNVFVEKPLCLTLDELQIIRELCVQPNSPLLMVGFNRRYAPLTEVIRDRIKTGTMSMLYRVNAGSIPSDSWIQDSEVGGGRILGEVCHFVDYLTWVNGSRPISVHAVSMKEPENLDDTLSISLKYKNGSIGSILYFANGSKSFGKEYLEIYCHGTTCMMKDFRELEIYGFGKPYKKKLLNQDKGQKNEVLLFIKAVREGAASLIFVEDFLNSTEVTFRVIESLRTGNVIHL